MRHALIVLLVFLSGCVTFHERTGEPEATPISSQKKIIGSMIVERIEARVKELVEEQSNLTVLMEKIQDDLQANDEWIRAGEVDPKEVYRF